MNSIIKLLLLFLWLDLFIYWLFTYNTIFIILWLINTIILLIFLDYKFDLFIKIFKNINNKQVQKNKIINYNKITTIKENLIEFYNLIKYINKHYIIFTSILIFILIFLSKFFWYTGINFNISTSWIILILSVIIWFKDIITWNIYFWNKKLEFLDYIVFSSIILFYIFFNINWELKVYENLLIWAISAFSFYVFTTNFLWISEKSYWKYKPSLLLFSTLLISILYFMYWFFWIKTMYNDFYIWKSIIIENKIQLWEKILITPDNKEFKILKKWDLYIVEWKTLEENIAFSSLKETEIYLLSDFKKEKFINDKLDEINKNDSFTWTWIITDKELIPYLLKDKNYDSLYNINITLPNISTNIENYKYYNIAYSLWLININSNLTDKVYCLNYITMLWIVEKWDISEYKNSYFFKKYYLEWIKRDLLPLKCINNTNQLINWEEIKKD